MKNSELLKKAREKIADEKHWTKHTYAATKSGKGVPYDDPSAFCFCALGAVRAAGDLPPSYARSLLLPALPPEYAMVSRYNDSPKTKHADVLAMFDRAIAHHEAVEARIACRT